MRTCRLPSVSGSDRVECDLVHIQIEFFLRRTRLGILRQRFGRMGQANIGGAVGSSALTVLPTVIGRADEVIE